MNLVSFLTTALQVFGVELISVFGFTLLLFGYIKSTEKHHVQ